MVQALALTGTAWPPGIVEVDWYSGEPRNDGDAFIYVETAGRQVADTVWFITSGPPVYTTVLAYPSSLIADGEDKGLVIVQVRDINDNWVVAATPVSFKTNFGTINGGGTQDGWINSVYETEYHSQVLKKDYSPDAPDDGIGAVSVVRVQSGGAVGPTNSFQTLFLTGNTYVGNCDILIEPEIEPSATVPFSIVVKDRAGNPLGGHSLEIHASLGTLSAIFLTSNEYGEVNLFFTAPAVQGATIITVTDRDPRGEVSFAKKVKIKTED
jgi:hypothetical protein